MLAAWKNLTFSFSQRFKEKHLTRPHMFPIVVLSGSAWFRVVLHGFVWFCKVSRLGVVWRGLAWFGMIWCGFA